MQENFNEYSWRGQIAFKCYSYTPALSSNESWADMPVSATLGPFLLNSLRNDWLEIYSPRWKRLTHFYFLFDFTVPVLCFASRISAVSSWLWLGLLHAQSTRWFKSRGAQQKMQIAVLCSSAIKHPLLTFSFSIKWAIVATSQWLHYRICSTINKVQNVCNEDCL